MWSVIAVSDVPTPIIRVGALDDRPAMLLGLQQMVDEAPDMVMTASGSRLGDVCFVDIDVLLVRQGIFDRMDVDGAFLTKAAGVACITTVDELSLELFREEIRRAMGKEDHDKDMRDEAEFRLSARESTALKWIATGLTHSQIGRRMGISRHTVDTYIKRIRAKLGLGNKAELTRAAVALGLLPRAE
jgi:DNA-binding CsgD family transcriptional regulator